MSATLLSSGSPGGPSFSVVITCYNYERYVLQAVDSVLSQSVRPKEVVVVDDGSTDGSLAKLRSRYREEATVRLIESPNAGQLSAFVKGVSECTGDIICFLDADDFWDDDYLQLLRDIYSSQPTIDFVFANLKIVGKGGGVWHDTREDCQIGVSVLWTHANPWGPWSGSPTSALSMRAPLCRRVLTVPEEWYSEWRVRADDCLVYGASLLGGCKYFSSAARVNYRVHDANAWFSRRDTNASSLKHQWSKNRMVAFYASKVGLPGTTPPMAALLEFHSKGRPTLAHLFFYIREAWAVRWSWWMRARQTVSMVRHYLARRNRVGT